MSDKDRALPPPPSDGGVGEPRNQPGAGGCSAHPETARIRKAGPDEQGPPDLFSRIRMNSRSTCAFCIAVWDVLESGRLEKATAQAFELHLKEKHGWVMDEWTVGEEEIGKV